MELPKHILVATDFSPSAELAVDYATKLAASFGAKLHIVHAYVLPVLGLPENGFIAQQQIIGHIVKDAEVALKEAVEKRKASGVAMTTHLSAGDPRDAILEAAKEVKADWIVMGTHGRRGLSRLLIGSVAEAVVRTAHCPVLTIRQP